MEQRKAERQKYKKERVIREDAIEIEPQEKYYFDANCTVALICNPAWQKENHKWIR